MIKKFSKFETTTIKRTAMNVSSMVLKKKKLLSKIEELQEEYEQICLMQDQYEAPIKTMTGGYTTEDLIDRIVESTNTFNKEGKEVKTTKYVFKYPETIIPTVEDTSVDINTDDTKIETDLQEVSIENVDDSEVAPEVEDKSYNPFESN